MATKNKHRQRQPKTRRIGIITAGGDSPGLNAAIRSVGKAALATMGMEIVGYRDGFRGRVEDLRVRLNKKTLSGILTVGGTILGTGRDKPHRMLVDGEKRDMTDLIVENYEKNDLEALVCIGGGGTHKSVLKLVEKGLKVITLPKTSERTVEKNKRKELKRELGKLEDQHVGNSLQLARQLEELTDLESRVTILGYVQRGGIPSAGDRLLATRLGTMAVELIQEKLYGVMVAARGDGAEPVPMASVAGNLKTVPTNHPWVHCARNVGTCLGE